MTKDTHHSKLSGISENIIAVPEDTQTGATPEELKRRVPEQFRNASYDGRNGPKAWLAGFDAGVASEMQERDTLKRALVEIINDGAWSGGGWCSRIAEAALAADLKGDPR